MLLDKGRCVYNIAGPKAVDCDVYLLLVSNDKYLLGVDAKTQVNVKVLFIRTLLNN